MLLFSDYCLSCLETTITRQGKKVWILNGMKNYAAAWLPALTVRQFLQRQGWLLGSMLNCGEKTQLSYVKHCPLGAWPEHWCERPLQRQSTAIALPWDTDGCGKSQELCTALAPLLSSTAMYCLAMVQPFPNCLFCCNLSWHLHYA